MAIPLHVRIATPLALLALAGAGIACDSGSGGTAASGGSGGSSSDLETGKLGTPVKTEDGKSLLVETVKRNFHSEGTIDQPGKECVLVTIALTNGSKSEWTLPTYSINVVDAQGAKYDQAFGCGENSTAASSLVAGGHIEAPIAFQVPTGSPLNLTWHPDLFSGSTYQLPLQ